MSSLHQQKPVVFGAIIEPPLRSQASHDSALSITTAEKETGFDSTNPYSAFYKHPCARRSMEDKDATITSLSPAASHSKQHLDLTIRDLESGLTPLSAATTQHINHNLSTTSVDGRVKECTMWPSRQAVLQQKKMSKRAKGWRLFGGLNSKQRLWAKILIALLVIAGAVGLGIGISKAVGGGVWKSTGQTQDIA